MRMKQHTCKVVPLSSKLDYKSYKYRYINHEPIVLWISKVGRFRKMGKPLKCRKKVIWLKSKKVKKKK